MFPPCNIQLLKKQCFLPFSSIIIAAGPFPLSNFLFTNQNIRSIMRLQRHSTVYGTVLARVKETVLMAHPA